MRIDNWPLDRIMRLPDWCFGRRWWTGMHNEGLAGVIHLNIAEEELPDKFVVWGALLCCRTSVSIVAMRVTLRLSDHVPANAAEALTLDRLFKSISTPTSLYEFYPNPNGLVWLPAERQIVESNGRRLVVVTIGDDANTYEMTVGLLISSMPREVPDWLISGQAANQF